MNCTNCGRELPAGSKFCTQCGTPAPAALPACPECGYVPETESKFCVRCGAAMAGAPAAPKAAPKPQPKPAQQPKPMQRPVQQPVSRPMGRPSAEAAAVCTKARTSGILGFVSGGLNIIGFIFLLIGSIACFGYAGYAAPYARIYSEAAAATAVGVIFGIILLIFALGYIGMIILNVIHGVRCMNIASAGQTNTQLLHERYRNARPGGFLALNIIFGNVAGIVCAAFNIAACNTYRTYADKL